MIKKPETMSFNYSGSFEDETHIHVNFNFTPEELTLEGIAERFLTFLQASGFNYVTSVTIKTENGNEITSN